MSKSLNLYLPAIGGAALMLGVAYGVASRDYGGDKIEALEAHVEKAQTDASKAAELASAEAARAAEMEKKVAEIQSAAAMRVANGAGSLTEPAPQPSKRFGLGRTALPEEVAAWDVDVRPDGSGLPEGRGDVLTGEAVFEEHCSSCHGVFAEGVDNWPVLAGGFDTLADKDPVKTVGSYWPYLSTVWDYVNRSMPFGAAQTMSHDDVYAIVAYILYSNDLVDEDFELSNENFLDVEMYNTGGFIVDDRAETEYSIWTAEPCMTDCKESVEITMHASVLDVTPDEEIAAESEGAVTTAKPVETAAVTTGTETAAVAESAMAVVDPALVEAGEKVFAKCKACHQVGEGAKNRSGPILTGIVGSDAGGADGFKYSKSLISAAEGGLVWNEDELAGFLAAPKSYLKGTKMSFAGLKSDDDIAAVIAYLKSFEK